MVIGKMKNSLLLVLTLIGFTGPALAVEAPPEGDAAAGKGNTEVCVACHGADGNSSVGMYPNLAGQNERYLFKQLSDIQSGARPVPSMTGMLDGMDKQDLADIAAYYASNSHAVGQADPELAKRGEEIYRGGIREKEVPACAACHSATGSGNALAGFPLLSGQHAEYTVTQLESYRAAADGDPEGRANDGDDTRIMRTISYRMSDSEIRAVASYIQGLH